MTIRQMIKELEKLDALIDEIVRIGDELADKPNLTEEERAQFILIEHLRRIIKK